MQVLRIWGNFQEGYTIKHKKQFLKGQALVELASLGTILILCLAMLIKYGMQANYQQNLQMQAFRRATKAAYYKTGPAATMSLSTTKDQGIPDPRDQWGFADREPMGASASATWDNNVNSDYIEDYSQTPQQRDLPRSIIELNNTADTHTLGLTAGDFSGGGINNIGEGQGAFTTAAYRQGSCNGNIMVVLENDPHGRTREYQERNIPCAQIRVFDRSDPDASSGKHYAYYMINGIKYRLSAADVDRDDELETIIAVRGSQACDSDGYCGRISAFKYVDYQEGKIDTEETIIYPWETNKHGALLEAQQGLISDYSIARTDNNTMQQNDSSSRLNTTTNLGATQQTLHTIRFNSGAAQGYRTTFTPKDASFTMGGGK